VFVTRFNAAGSALVYSTLLGRGTSSDGPGDVVVDGTGAVIVTELLFARITGDRRPTQRVVLPTRLVPRGSGERTP
jgi:hypothetical protein